MSYNRMGLRDKDYPPRPASGTVRILLSGSSVAAGSGLDEPEAPPRALERALRKKGIRAEVINGADEGTTTWQNSVILKDLLGAYHPKIVVYHLLAHYIFTDLAVWDDLRKERGRIVGRKGPFAFLHADQKRAKTARHRPILHGLIRLCREQLGRIRWSWKLAKIDDPERKLDVLLRPTLRELTQMCRDSQSAGARFYVLYDGDEVNADQYPVPAAYYWIPRIAQGVLVRPFQVDGMAVLERLQRAQARFGCKALSLADVRSQLKDPANRLERDYHWNAAGSDIFGKAAAEKLFGEIKGARRSTTRKTQNPAAPLGLDETK